MSTSNPGEDVEFLPLPPPRECVFQIHQGFPSGDVWMRSCTGFIAVVKPTEPNCNNCGRPVRMEGGSHVPA